MRQLACSFVVAVVVAGCAGRSATGGTTSTPPQGAGVPKDAPQAPPTPAEPAPAGGTGEQPPRTESDTAGIRPDTAARADSTVRTDTTSPRPRTRADSASDDAPHPYRPTPR